jgi:hypothetical protein
LKVEIKGRCFDKIEDIVNSSQDVIKTLTRNDFQQFFLSWKSRWDRCINAKEVNFKGGGDK